MYFRALFILLFSLLTVSYGDTLQGTVDLKNLQKILQDNANSKDIGSLYYALKGLKQLNVKIPDVCDIIKTTKYNLKNIEQVFYLTNAAVLSGCQNYLKPEVLSAPTHILDKKDATIADIYYAVFTLKALGKGTIYDREEGLSKLVDQLKNNDSVANYGYLFGLCEHMGCGAWTTSRAAGVLVAAVETDGKTLHFEGGLPVTSLLLTTIIRSYKSMKKPSPLNEKQRYKFAEYLLSRRSVTTAKGAALLLDAAITLADDEPSPIAIINKGKKYITHNTDAIEFSVTDLIGRPVRGLKPEDVVAQSATRLSDDVVVLSKQPLTPKSNDPTTFTLNPSKIQAQNGVYKIVLSAAGKTGNVNIAVLGEMHVTTMEVGIGDADGTTTPKITTLTYPNKLKENLQADHMQKFTLKFSVRDKENKPVLVQQAFMRIGSLDSDFETFFVAEPDNTKAYKVELNVGSIAKHLDHKSGPYSVTVYLGDNSVSSPIAWDLGVVVFNFGSSDGHSAGVVGRKRGPLAEISHLFRSQEARPPRLVSDAFAAACALPLLLLLALWARLGINFGNFPAAISAPLFHLSLGACLGLYGMLWLKLTMFETARYLLPLGALVFLSGHRLLRSLVSNKTR